MVKVILPAHLQERANINRKRNYALETRGQFLLETHTASGVGHSSLMAALSYAQLGWAVLPVHGIKNGACTCSAGLTCTSAGKHPTINGGVNSASKDVTTIVGWWREFPEANVGIAMGAISGVFAIDVDPRNGGEDSISWLHDACGPVRKTVRSDTGGGGDHRLYAYPDIGMPSGKRFAELPGIDIQSDGSFIVAPPSLHGSGRRYAWRKGQEPASVNLATLPASWDERLRRKPKPPVAVALSGQVVSEGSRNAHLTSRAGALRQFGLSAEAILAALRAENTAHCVPPLDDDEVGAIATSVQRYPAGSPADQQDEAETVMKAVLDAHYAGGAHLLRPSDGEFWAYDGTRWATISKGVLSKNILGSIRGMPPRRGRNTSALMGQTIKLIEAQVARAGDPLGFMSKPPPVVNCRNGELWIGDDGAIELRPHSPISYLRHRLEIDYDPTAACPRYDRAVREIFSKADDPAEMVDFWHELTGYAMQPDRRVPLVVLGYGTGSNGKTRLLETYTRLVGPELVMAMAIGDLEKSRFITAALLGKLAIVDDDVKAGTRLPDGQLKKLSEEKTVTGENKFGPPFTFTSHTAIFMLFNNPPSLADLSYGMQRRLIAVPFDRSFSGNEADPGLFQEIWAQEMAGVLNRYLEGLRRVIQRKWRLAPPPCSEDAKTNLLKAANPLPAFIDERCERTGSIYVQALYDAYKDWAQRSGIQFQQQRLSFQRNLEQLGFQVGRGNEGLKFHGLRLRRIGSA